MSETEETTVTNLKQVRFNRSVTGPRGRSMDTMSATTVDSLFLMDDVVCWEKGDTRWYIPLANVSCFEVA